LWQCVASLGAPLCNAYNSDIDLIANVGQRCAQAAQNGQFSNECDRYGELVLSIPTPSNLAPNLSNTVIEAQSNANDCIEAREENVNDVNAQFTRFDLYNGCNRDLNVMYWTDGQFSFCLNGCLNRINSGNWLPLGSEFNSYFFAACYWPSLPAPLLSNGNVDVSSISQGVVFNIEEARNMEFGCF